MLSLKFVNFCLLRVVLCLYTDFVTDMDFSPFDDRLLSTCSYDNLVRTRQLLAVSWLLQIKANYCAISWHD